MKSIRFLFLSALLVLSCISCSQKLNIKPGTAQVITTDTTPTPTPVPGAATRWMATTSHVWASLDGGVDVTTATQGTILKYTKIEDPLNEYDSTRGMFSPKVSGLYQINASVTLPGLSATNTEPWIAGDFCSIVISKTTSGPVAVNRSVMPASSTPCSVAISTIVPVAVGEVVVVSVISTRPRMTIPITRNPYATLTIGLMGL